MNIKKVDDKPMVIHTKEKAKLHIKGAAETKIKGRNVLTVQRGPKISGFEDAVKRTDVRRNPAAEKEKIRQGQTVGKAATKTAQQTTDKRDKQSRENGVRKSVNSESRIYSQYRRSKADREAAIGKKSGVLSGIGAVATKSALDQMEGGSEIYDSYMVASTLSKPVTNATDAGRNLYRSQVARVQAQKIKKMQAGKKIGRKAVKESAVRTAKKTAQKAAKETAKTAAKETTKAAAKAAAATAGTAAGTAATGVGGVLIGAAAGEAAGIAMDKRNVKNSTRNRMIRLFVAKLRQEENQDSIGKALKDIVLMRFSMLAKYLVRYVGMFLLGLFAVVALMSLPIIAVIAIIYNSPFAIFFPSISSGETTQQVLSAYVEEFNTEVNTELTDHDGYDTSEKIYVNFEGAGTPDNFCDILAVYMVKYGDGDTATDMTDTAKSNLKSVFDNMCSYTITSRTDTDTDEEGNTTTTTVKEVNVELKTYHDMIGIYGFNAEEQEMLAELMKPEYLAMLGYSGGGGDPGESISPEQYQAIVDAVSDANGKKVVEFVLSKVGYPYSQAYRDSGDYYDCSSLAYYAWKNAGVNIMYEGANTAASEGKYCYDNNLLVNYEEMQPGDLVFYSYGNNGRFMNITHVAVYVGNGKVVEAANERIGVVYRSVQSRSSIVMLGRPR